tara:strand:+ start:321 stop:1103 length:783 start_codon:yes stop_codon:yes gene_type:complete
MAKKELTKYEDEVVIRLKAVSDEYISPYGERKGIGQKAFAKKHGFSQPLLSQCLNKNEYLRPYIIEAIASESGIAITTLDPNFHSPNRWLRPNESERKANASEGHLLYILEQPDRDIDRPIAKLGITNNVLVRLRSINSPPGVSDNWWLYRVIELGTGNARDVERETLQLLKGRYESVHREVFHCEPSAILGAATRVISKKGKSANAMWCIDPDNISDRLQEEFEAIVEEKREWLESQKWTEDEIDDELRRPIEDAYWWN